MKKVGESDFMLEEVPYKQGYNSFTTNLLHVLLRKSVAHSLLLTPNEVLHGWITRRVCVTDSSCHTFTTV